LGSSMPKDPGNFVKVPVGHRPGGLAFDSARSTLLAANVGDPTDPASRTLSIVDTERRVLTASIPVAGPTRWAVFDPAADRFFVVLAEPAAVLLVEGSNPTRVSAKIPIPAAGPHGLDVDAVGRLYCACDAGRLLVLTPPAYDVVADVPLSGIPDVILLDPELRQLYVAIRGPAVIRSSTSIGSSTWTPWRPSPGPTRSASTSIDIGSTRSCRRPTGRRSSRPRTRRAEPARGWPGQEVGAA
jgi:hypothetical protein